MTVNRGPGVAPIAGVGTTTLEHRLQLAGLYAENAPGVPRSGVLAQATDQLVVGRADMSYDVGPTPLVISRTAAEGVYTPTLTGTTNVVTSAAPGTNSRWDLIYVKQNDQAKGDADNAAVIGVQQGTAAASPTKPTADLPSGAYVLAEARIFATTTGTSGGSNTIAQVWRHTAARGAPVPVRNLTERDEITTPAKGQKVVRLDLSGCPHDAWNGTAWTVADTPWTDLATVQGFAANNTSGWAGIKYAVKDGWVIINGSVSRGTAWGADQTIAVIPTTLKPAYKIQGSGVQVEPTVGNITLPAGSTAASFSATWPLF